MDFKGGQSALLTVTILGGGLICLLILNMRRPGDSWKAWWQRDDTTGFELLKILSACITSVVTIVLIILLFWTGSSLQQDRLAYRQLHQQGFTVYSLSRSAHTVTVQGPGNCQAKYQLFDSDTGYHVVYVVPKLIVRTDGYTINESKVIMTPQTVKCS